MSLLSTNGASGGNRRSLFLEQFSNAAGFAISNALSEGIPKATIRSWIESVHGPGGARAYSVEHMLEGADPTAPVGMMLGSGSAAGLRLPGLGGLLGTVGTVVGTAAAGPIGGAVGGWLGGLFGGGRGGGATGGGTPGTIAFPGIPGAPPGLPPMGPQQAGFLTPGTVGAVGGAVGRVAGSRAGRRIIATVGGILGYYVFDKALGWIFKPGKPPSRRMNVLNPRALTRANRRMEGFRTVSTKALRELGYTVARSGSKRNCGCKPKRRAC